MKSIKEILKIGKGPSSSHTMGPEKAARLFVSIYPNEKYKVVLYDSLAKTGKGHKTDAVIKEVMGADNVEIVFDPISAVPHPNTLDFYTTSRPGERMRVFSIGGGEIVIEGKPQFDVPEVYEKNSFSEIADECRQAKIRLSDYVELKEGAGIWDYLQTVWVAMKNAIYNGIDAVGILDGGLNVERKAQYLYNQRYMDETSETREHRLVCAYAFAVSEENASGGTIVTAPTCGASGVLPATLKYMQDKRGFSDRQICKALAVAGLLGAIIKQNASISGAECGCQAEIGSACSMAAGALAELYEMGLPQVEYAAEIALEHHLGLTCDPVGGLVQIPCIERNAVAAMRAINAVSLSNFLYNTRLISFDVIVKTMYETGRDICGRYRETGEGGLAKSVLHTPKRR